jgi:large subunit ribosomal protein L6e
MTKFKARMLRPGITAQSRTATNRRRRVYIHAKQGANGKKIEAKKVKLEKPAVHKWYPTEATPRAIPSNKSHLKPTRLRKSITPGTVLILLSGRFRAKRVVFLKQLPSGLLLVTGPYKINGVPLRRVNQAYVIATSTRIKDIDKIVDVSKINDDFFAKDKSEKKKNKQKMVTKKKGKSDPLADSKKKKRSIKSSRVSEQKRVDGLLLPHILNKDKYPYLKHYLNAKFSLTNALKPHLMKF